MYDLQRVGKIIADIEKHFKELESYKIQNIESLFDSKTYHASSMLVFAILNRVIDLGGEILSAENLGAPSSYRDILPLLSKAGVLNKQQADEINFLIKNRNLLAHFYDDLSEKELFKIIKDLSALKNFVLIAKKRIFKTETGL